MQECFSNYNVKEQEIECKTLDTLCLEIGLEKIDYLKIDTEGAEYKILSGARNLLQKQKITFIQFEYGLPDKNIPSVELIYQLLEEYEYKKVLVSGREQLWTNQDTYSKV